MTENVTFDDFNKNLKRLCDQFQLLESRYEGKGRRLIMTLSSLFKTRCFPKCVMSGKL